MDAFIEDIEWSGYLWNMYLLDKGILFGMHVF